MSNKFWKLNITRARHLASAFNGYQKTQIWASHSYRTPKKPKTPLDLTYKEAFLNFRATIFLDHPDDKMSLEDMDAVFAKAGEVLKQPTAHC